MNTPLPVQGTVSVNNFPATQPVSGTVAVSNFPATQQVSGTVNVGNFPATQNISFNGTAQPVSFSNTSSTPLYTRDVDNAAHNALGEEVSCTVSSGAYICFAPDISVPSGMELVVETISVEAAVPSGQKPEVIARFSTNGNAALAEIPTTFEGNFQTVNGARDIYAVTQPLRLYADSNTNVQLEGGASTNAGGALFTFTLTGHLVSCGSGSGCPVP